MLHRLLFGVLALFAVAGCSTEQSETVVEQVVVTSPATTEAPVQQIIAPAGLVQAVSMSVTNEDLNLDEQMVISNDGAIGIFSPVATCSLGEGGSWFPLEIVASGESFLRLASVAPIPDGFTAIDGQLSYQSPKNISFEAAVTVYIDEARASGSFVGNDDQGRDVSGEFECVASFDEATPQVDVNTELSIRLVKSDGSDVQLVRRLGLRTSTDQTCPTTLEVGLRTSTDQTCPTTLEGTADRWFVEHADQPVGGLTGAMLAFSSSTGSWVGEFEIAEHLVVVEALTVSEMPTGLVFSGVSADGYAVDGALTC